MSVSDDVRKQFVDYIMLQVFDDQYIDRQEEKKILQEGVTKGVGVEEGLAIIRQVVSEKGLILERDAEERTKEMLETFASNDGKVDKKEFADAMAIFKNQTKGKIPEHEMQKRLKIMMVENGWNAKEGGLFGSKWFSAIQV
jgi:Ca2+-binding EF-hand superfamily protein